MEMVSFAEFQSKLGELLDAAKRHQEQYTIVKNDEPTAVVLSYEEWESMMETMVLLADPQEQAELAESEAAVARGETYSVAEAKAALAQRLQQ